MDRWCSEVSLFAAVLFRICIKRNLCACLLSGAGNIDIIIYSYHKVKCITIIIIIDMSVSMEKCLQSISFSMHVSKYYMISLNVTILHDYCFLQLWFTVKTTWCWLLKKYICILELVNRPSLHVCYWRSCTYVNLVNCQLHMNSFQ